jgi:hypothetical protein
MFNSPDSLSIEVASTEKCPLLGTSDKPSIYRAPDAAPRAFVALQSKRLVGETWSVRIPFSNCRARFLKSFVSLAVWSFQGWCVKSVGAFLRIDKSDKHVREVRE